jgi:hypothetical protein
MPRTLRSLVTFAVAASCGCAGVSSEARQRPLVAALDAMPIERPLEEVWPAVQLLLAERGFPLAGKDAEAAGQGSVGFWGIFSRAKETAATGTGGRRLETGWGPRQTRYVAEAVGGDGAWRVRLTLVSENATEHGHDGAQRRDAAAELELVRRLDPARAVAIQMRAGSGEPPQGPPASPKP